LIENRALEAVELILAQAERSSEPIGAILVEPILGRGGLVVPTPTFLARLRALCDGERRVLILDEVYTGCGRTGRWFACEHDNVVPDLLVAGKAMSGSLPIAAMIGTPAVMLAWPASRGEAIHTSTFLGNPVACAAALAQLDEIESRGLIERAARLGESIRARTDHWCRRFDLVREARGRGLLQGVALDGDAALDVVTYAARHGVLILAEGGAANVLAITPPAVITDQQLDFALDVLEAGLALC
jgi:4-aminobutyrate aminotransferase-like enzyme